MTPLRKEMIRELELRRKSTVTVDSYVKSVEELARYYGRSPDKISLEEIRDYMHHLIVEKKYSYSYRNLKLVAINFFHREVLGRDGDLRTPRTIEPHWRLPDNADYPRPELTTYKPAAVTRFCRQTLNDRTPNGRSRSAAQFKPAFAGIAARRPRKNAIP